jgi:YD repeat-containing protein
MMMKKKTEARDSGVPKRSTRNSIMYIRRLLVIALVGGTLTACGSGKSPALSAAANRAAAASLPANASAAEVAAHMRGDVHCPADTAASVPGVPVDDVVGVRPGMGYDEAANVVMCSNPLLVVTPETGRGFNVQTYGQTIRQGFSARFAEPRVQKTSRQIMQDMQQDAMDRTLNEVRQDMKPGQSKWFVSTMGMPGQEKVISVAREQWFDEGRSPTIDSIEQSLVAKYGTPTQRIDQANYHQVRWAYDPRGRLITETSPLYNQCNGVFDPDSGVSVSPDCGVITEARIQPLLDNPALAQDLQVGVVDEASGYAALTATEQGLQAMDAARRAKQVKDAAKNAQAPKL